MNKEKLVEAANRNETSKKVFELLYNRKRNTQYTHLGSMRNDLKLRTGHSVDIGEFNRVFTELEHIGVGKGEYGERGTLKGFRWSLGPRDVGRVGLGIPEEQPVVRPPRGLKRGPITIIVLRPGEKPQTAMIPEEAVNDSVVSIIEKYA